jgi:toxin ParE1/3/4
VGQVKIILSPRFREELRREQSYIRKQNPQAAKKVRDRIRVSIGRLFQYPMSGRAWRLKGTLELVIPGLPYIVTYRVIGNEVHILTLFHTARNFPPDGTG